MGPLFLPKELKEPTSAALFFRELPIVGLISRRRRAIRRQLIARKAPETKATWREDAALRRIAADISELIRDHCHWPNANFIPDDRCDLLISDSRYGLQSVCALLEISKRFHLSDSTLEIATSGTVGELSEFILTQQIRKQ